MRKLLSKESQSGLKLVQTWVLNTPDFTVLLSPKDYTQFARRLLVLTYLSAGKTKKQLS